MLLHDKVLTEEMPKSPWKCRSLCKRDQGIPFFLTRLKLISKDP